MQYPKKYTLIAFLIIVAYAFILNEWNIRCIRTHNPQNKEINSRSLVYNAAIYSVDNVWYLPQIKFFLAGKGFTSNPNKVNYGVRRTPVYPIFYGVHYIIFGEKGSFYFIRFTQILLFAWACIALFVATFNFTKNKKTAIITACLFAFNPTLVSYLYYTITEAVSPALVCFLLYFLSRCFIDNSKKNWFFLGVIFAIGSLCRTTIFFFIIPLFIFGIYQNKKSIKLLLTSSLFFIFGAGILFIPNTIRNYIVTKGDFVLLEKYYGDPMDYGMPNIELRSWISCWTNPADYSSEVISNTMLIAIAFNSNDTKEKIIEKLMSDLPPRATIANKKEDIKIAYESLYDYYLAINKEVDSIELKKLEAISLVKMRELKSVFILHAPLQYYIITPLLFFKSIIFQSNAATLALLDNYQKSNIQKTIKIILYLLNVFLFISIIGASFYSRNYITLYLVCILFIATNFLYITFIIKCFEVRYLIPVFPSMYILCAIFYSEILCKRQLKL
jgi:4-amino-4-deoxy-L-arabinose transferase-like glycosyltransferase